MKKKVNIKLNKHLIEISFNDVLQKHTIICEFVSLNIYQIVLNKLTISNSRKKHVNVTSTELRKINIHTLTKRSIKLINAFIDLDTQSATKVLNFLYLTNINYEKLLKEINKKSNNRNRNIFLAKFSYVYIHTCLSYESNISYMLSKQTGYSINYIKNIVKECFQKGYLKQSSKGISGGVLSTKTINYLKQ